MNTSVKSATISAKVVSASRRLAFLPKHFAKLHPAVEAGIYDVARTVDPEYRGGYWEFVELSNGGGYLQLATERPIRVVVNTNGYAGTMSADAASIVVNLLALSELSFIWQGHRDSDRVIDTFYALREYASCHAEAAAIFAAID